MPGNNAGILHIGTVEQISEEQWDETFRYQLPRSVAAFALGAAFWASRAEGGVIRKTPDPGAVRRERISVHPLGRLGAPEDLAGLAVYLAGDESCWVTGAALPVDGGYFGV